MSDTIQYSTELGPLIEAESIPYSFLVPGWYMVGAVLLLAGLLVALLQLRKYLKNAYRREALKQVDAILGGKAAGWTYGIGLLLKELAMERFGREPVAALQGVEWYRFLQSTAKPNPHFSEGDFEAFVSYSYNAQVPDRDLGNKLGDFARHWIKTHHAGRI